MRKGLQFEWDPKKAGQNARKHGVEFVEARTVFFDPEHVMHYDDAHSNDEDRYKVIGASEFGRLLSVSVTDENGVVRIISARKATKSERNDYERR
ncbi:MAG: BrnT family toxin [Planctomycetes bacterium]|nr:BrnT family toxin [Planctomycetota bacterium]